MFKRAILLILPAIFLLESCNLASEEQSNLDVISSSEEIKIIRDELVQLRKKVSKLERQKSLSSHTGDLPSFAATSKKVNPSVVAIGTVTEYKTQWGAPAQGEGAGSGVILSADGYIITNNHVIDGATRVEVELLDKRIYPARVIGVDPTTDLALLKIDANNLPSIEIGDSDNVQIGEWVLAVGNPLNLSSTITAGIVSAKGRSINILNAQYSVESFIQTDAVVNPGNSGGALVDVTGQLVGINTAIVTQSGRYEGYSFAVPSNLVKKVAQDLKDFGVVQRGILGVAIRDITIEEAADRNLPTPKGVYIERVFDGGSANDAGMRKGDVILAINNKTLDSYSNLQEIIAQYRPGDAVEVDVLRTSNTVEKLTITLKNQNNSTALNSVQDASHLKNIGIEVRELNIKEKKALGLDGGVKILNIIKSSPVAKAKVLPGFIILSVNQSRVRDISSMVDLFNRSPKGITFEGIYPNSSKVYRYTIQN